MRVSDWVRSVAILGPIFAMIVLGVVLAARSGVARLASAGGTRRVLDNLSQAAALLGGCLIGLAVIHHLVGQHLPRFW